MKYDLRATFREYFQTIRLAYAILIIQNRHKLIMKSEIKDIIPHYQIHLN